MPASTKRPRIGDEILRPPQRATRKPVPKVRKNYHTIPHLGDVINNLILPNEFEHTPLSPDPQLDEIRVLVLHSGKPGDTIQCSFNTVSLSDGDNKVLYEALSYYWGTDQPSHKIGVVGFKKLDKGVRSLRDMKVKKFYIRDNLRAALEKFREEDRENKLVG